MISFLGSNIIILHWLTKQLMAQCIIAPIPMDLERHCIPPSFIPEFLGGHLCPPGSPTQEKAEAQAPAHVQEEKGKRLVIGGASLCSPLLQAVYFIKSPAQLVAPELAR